MNLKVIITGATGMVGEDVLHECLLHPGITNILVIHRKPCGVSHPKLVEIIHSDFMDLSSLESKLTGYDACFFCLGISSVGLNETDYTKMTYHLTMHIAQVLVKANPTMTFCYVSGKSTDSTEKGNLMWARVKGKTENDLIKLPFKAVYNFRPAVISPTQGLKNTLVFYKYLGWLLPVIKSFAPNYITSLKELGTAMINVADEGYAKKVLEVKDIRLLAGR